MATIERREFLAGSVGALARPAYGAAARRPNVLFVLVDEWRAQATGYAGDRNARTPALDRLAGESVNFENAVSCLPVCSPYRASLMTGQYPLSNGVYINDVPLQPKGTTLGQAFSRAGYRTGYIGKWHLYGSPDGRYGRRMAYVPPQNRFGFAYWKACECTHNYDHSLYYEGTNARPKYWSGYDAVAQTEDACQFIAGQKSSRDPYFLLLSLGPPHFPVPLHLTPPERYYARYAEKEIHLRPNVDPAKKQKAVAELRKYYAHIDALNDCLERLLGAVEKSGAAENTVVVFTSDHGDMMLSQGLTTKLYPWEESVRVPFLVRHPRQLGRKGRRVSVPLNSPDVMPTLLGLCGVPVPEEVEGFDYSPALLGKERRGMPQAAFLSLPAPFHEARRFGFAAYRGVRTATHTYVRSINGPWLLYDNVADPYQMHNRCGQSGVREVQAKLDDEVDKFLSKLHDEFLPGEAYLKRDGLTHYGEVSTAVGYCRSPWGDWESTLRPA